MTQTANAITRNVSGAFAALAALVIFAPAALADQFVGIDAREQAVTSPPVQSTLPPSVSQPANTTSLHPFGYNLFSGDFSREREQGLNPNYRISEGDEITVRIWGATEVSEVIKVDAQGNIFIPGVGPVPVLGLPNGELNGRVEKAVKSVFTNNVRVYTSLNGTQPVGVFVTGFVKNPGRYSGVPSSSMLYYLDRAGGIDDSSGSYRDIRLLRDGVLQEQVDLYRFLTDGLLPTPQFKDGDTIVVGPRSNTVTVTGDVRNAYVFEIRDSSITGTELMELARPRADASHADISGVAAGKGPYSIYVALTEFKKVRLHDGDRIEFTADQREDMVLIGVEGSFLGPSRFSVPKGTTLKQLLDFIPVDPDLADIDSISLRRQSLVQRQKQSLEDSLRRLESTYLLASSATDEEARIRTQEASMITDFIKRARQVEPAGRLVLPRDDSKALDIVLEEGDTVVIPQKSQSVLVSGEVLVPQALIFEPRQKMDYYIQRAGGLTDHANPDRILLLHHNGEVVAAKDSELRPGDEILVLPEVQVKNLQISKDIVDVMYKVAISAAVALRL